MKEEVLVSFLGYKEPNLMPVLRCKGLLPIHNSKKKSKLVQFCNRNVNCCCWTKSAKINVWRKKIVAQKRLVEWKR